MLTSQNDHLITLLASLGFATDSPEEIVIDNFDQWTNPDAARLANTIFCGISIEMPTTAAA
jgi:hypothetical protein